MIDNETRRELDQLKAGTTFAAGSFDLNVSSTSTTVTRNGVSIGSVVHTTAYSSVAANADITRVVPFKGGFTVTHNSSSTAGRTHMFSFRTPQS